MSTAVLMVLMLLLLAVNIDGIGPSWLRLLTAMGAGVCAFVVGDRLDTERAR